MERTIQVVQPMKLSERKVLRVAAYARVSCDKDAMKHSLAAQISYYNKYIQRHSDWAFAGIYADEAYSGTKDDRPHFVLTARSTELSPNPSAASPVTRSPCLRSYVTSGAEVSAFTSTKRTSIHSLKLVN